MDWRLEVARRAVLRRLPFGDELRRLKRRWLGYEPDAANLRGTLSNLDEMQSALRELARTFEGATILEIGSGWFPSIPIMLALGGGKRVLMSDLRPHMDEITFGATLRFLREVMPEDQRLRAIRALRDLPVEYLTPFDACAIPDGTIDFVISRTVLEHIPPHDLLDLLRALRPKLARGGLMVHLIDHSDHLEHTDKSISRINFLTWPKWVHLLVNFLMMDGENRLRHHEYRSIFERAGFQVVNELAEVHEPTRARATSLALAPPYSSMTPEQLASLTSLYVLSARDIRPDPQPDPLPAP